MAKRSELNFAPEITAAAVCRHINASLDAAASCGVVIVPLSVYMRHYVLAGRIPPVFAEGANPCSVDVCHYHTHIPIPVLLPQGVSLNACFLILIPSGRITSSRLVHP